MIKKSLLLIILVCNFTALFSNNIDNVIRKAVDRLAQAYVNQQEFIYSRSTVTVKEIKNISPLAKDHYIGQTLEANLKTAINDSRVFRYVDRSYIEEALNELEMMLSGITENNEEIKAGAFENIVLLISGSVLEEGNFFILTLELIDLQSLNVITVIKEEIAKIELIKAGDNFAFEYIMANGLGFSANITPHYVFSWPQDPLTAVGDGIVHFNSGGGKITYRYSRFLKFSVDVSILMGDFLYDDRAYKDTKNIAEANKTAAYALNIWNKDGTTQASNQSLIEDSSIHYQVRQMITSISFPVSYVLPITQSFNLSLGLGPAINSILYSQVYDSLPMLYENKIAIKRYIVDIHFMGLGLLGNMDMEYFILPRLALNVGVNYLFNWMLPFSDPYAYSPTNGEAYYSKDNYSIEAFGLNPFQYPDGRDISENLLSANHLKIYLGLSVYF